MPVWRNWQTRGSQKPVSSRMCGFDSHRRHQGLLPHLNHPIVSRRPTIRVQAILWGLRSCGRGGTGRRAGLKPRWSNPCGFNSRRPHQNNTRKDACMNQLSLLRAQRERALLCPGAARHHPRRNRRGTGTCFAGTEKVCCESLTPNPRGAEKLRSQRFW